MAALMLALAAPDPAAAHEEAVLESPSSSVAAGGALPLEGKDFAAGERYALRLMGALREYELRDVEADADGRFSIELTLPLEVRPGSYQVVAVAADGDVAARLDVTVVQAAAAAGGTGRELAEEGGAGHGPDGGATAEEIRIERSRSGVEWGLIGLIIGAAGGGGLGLLRRGAAMT